MTLAELRRQCAGGENLYTEFKRKLPEWDKLMREVVAFANTEGGAVFIGVDDDGHLAGIKDPREIEEILGDKIASWVKPIPVFTIERVPITPKRAVIAVHVAQSQTKPHVVRKHPEAEKGTATIRIADSSVTASREMFELLKYEGRERNMKVEYGDKERALMQYLQENDFITVAAFAQIAKIPRSSASRTLVHLAKANVLRAIPKIDAPDQFVPRFD
ncbi:MAG: ATP-binding protein [Bacteroidota bacterium]